MEEWKGPLGTLWGTYYPKEYVVAVIDNPRQAQQAVEALRSAGWPPDEVRLFTGEEVLSNHQRFTEHRNLGQRLAASITSGSAEAIAMDRYLSEARKGLLFVTIHVPHSKDVQAVHRLLDQYQAHTIKYYAAIGIADVHP